MVPQKRHDLLLEAWARLPGDAVLLLAGDGYQRIEHEQRARDLGIANQVRFLGAMRDVPTLLAAADVSALASDWEGLPVALLESMAAGLPIVSTAVDGVLEMVGADEGILVPRNDADALAEALSSLLFDRGLAQRMGNAARAGVSARNDRSVMLAAYADVVAGAVDQGRAGRGLAGRRRRGRVEASGG
jgi:glycosyltransferase involved in cell wall biosynthesis